MFRGSNRLVMRMHMVNAAALEKWLILPDQAVVSHVLDGRVALFELLMRRHHERKIAINEALMRAGDARRARRAVLNRAGARTARGFASLPRRCDRVVAAVLARIG